MELEDYNYRYLSKWHLGFVISWILSIFAFGALLNFKGLSTSQNWLFWIEMALGVYIILNSVIMLRMAQKLQEIKPKYIENTHEQLKALEKSGNYEEAYQTLLNYENAVYIPEYILNYVKSIKNSKNHVEALEKTLDDFNDITERYLLGSREKQVLELTEDLPRKDKSIKQLINILIPDIRPTQKQTAVISLILVLVTWIVTSDADLTAAVAVGTFGLQLIEHYFDTQSD